MRWVCILLRLPESGSRLWTPGVSLAEPRGRRARGRPQTGGFDQRTQVSAALCPDAQTLLLLSVGLRQQLTAGWEGTPPSLAPGQAPQVQRGSGASAGTQSRDRAPADPSVDEKPVVPWDGRSPWVLPLSKSSRSAPPTGLPRSGPEASSTAP